MDGIRRKLSRVAAGKEPGTAFYFVLAYFLWSIVPHFHLLIHSHAGASHAHAALSGAQVRLANQVLDDLGPAGLPGTDEAEFEIAGTAPVRAFGEPSLGTGNADVAHAHFWEDANLAGSAPFPPPAPPAAALLIVFFIRYLAPALQAAGAALARGPPSFLFA